MSYGNENAMQTLLVPLMVYAAVIVIISLVCAVLSIVGLWKIFSKAGEKGWKAIVPFLNSYTMFKISWKPTMFWVYFALTCVTSFITRISSDSGFLVLLSFAASIASLVILIMLYNKLSHAFGKGTGFTVGLVFLAPIFLMILGFGSAQYQGNSELQADNTQM